MPDDTADIPVPGCKEKEMDLPDQVAAQLMATLVQTGNIAQANFVTAQKVLDYDHLENKRMVTLDEAVGVREVQSKVNPGGPAPAA